MTKMKSVAKEAISELEKHLDICLRLCRDHVEAAKGYEHVGNASAAMQMRSVANLLGALARGDKVQVITPAPTINGISELALERLRRVWRSLGKECEDLANGREQEDVAELPKKTLFGRVPGAVTLPTPVIVPTSDKIDHGGLTFAETKYYPPAEPPKPSENLATMSNERFAEIFPPEAAARAQIGAQRHPPLGENRLKIARGTALPKCEFRILCVLEMYKYDMVGGVKTETGALLRGQVAIAAVYAPRGGSFLRAFGWLKQRGLIVHASDMLRWRISDAGRIALGKPLRLPVGDELVGDWCRELAKAERDSLMAVYKNPDGLTKQQIAEATGYEVKGGSFLRALGHLRTLGLIEGKATMHAASMLRRKPL